MLLLTKKEVLVKKNNTSKSGMLCHFCDSGAWISIMELTSGICSPSFPFTSLGVPIIVGKYKIVYLNGLIEKVQKSLSNWSSRFLLDGVKPDFNQGCSPI